MPKKYTKETLQNKLFDMGFNISVIGEYVDCYTKIELNCNKHNIRFFQRPIDVVSRGRCGCKKCVSEKISKSMTLSHEEFLSRLYELNPNIELLSTYQNMHTKVRCRCKLDGYEWDALPTNLIDKRCGCPICNKAKVATGFNDIATTNPEYLDIIVDKEYAYTNSVHSHEKTLFRCPICNNEFESTMSLVHYQGLSCPSCSDGFSYPNKVMYNVLTNCGIDFIREFSDKWSDKRRYDFCIPSLNILIEMDGGLGHGNKVMKNSGLTKEDTIEMDKYKDKLARENGYTVIRIDSLRSDIDYIKDNILNSPLTRYIDLSNVDWDDVDITSRTTYIVPISNMINENYKVKEIANLLQICDATVKKYALIAMRYGLCKEIKF